MSEDVQGSWPQFSNVVALDNADEFHYYAAVLVFGKKSPKMKNFSAFTMEFFRKHKDMEVREASGLTTSGVLGISRCIAVSGKTMLETSNTEMVSETNKVVTVYCPKSKVKISDALFSDSEFENMGSDWNEMVSSKIRTFAVLIRSLYFQEPDQFPCLMSEYPNIVKNYFRRRFRHYFRSRKCLKQKWCNHIHSFISTLCRKYYSYQQLKRVFMMKLRFGNRNMLFKPCNDVFIAFFCGHLTYVLI